MFISNCKLIIARKMIAGLFIPVTIVHGKKDVISQWCHGDVLWDINGL